jgi:transposase
MPPTKLPFSWPGFEIDEVQEHTDVIDIFAHANLAEAICPACQTHSQRVHSYYQRTPADLAVSDRRVRLVLTVRRFRCQNEHCPKRTFAERWPEMLIAHAQRTERLNMALEAIAFVLGGQAGQRLASKLYVPASGDTLLRLIRRIGTPPVDNPKVIGVDDWAQRRGHVYGTLIVDLERHRAIDLLTDRAAETLADWLRQHPMVKIIARDRSGEYARGSDLGAPGAQQIADRWHLLVNLREAFERLLDRLRPQLGAYLRTEPPQKQAGIRVFRVRQRSQTETAARQGRRTRRFVQHEKVNRLYQAGYAIRAIARRLNMSRTTVYRYLSMTTLAIPVVRRRQPSQLDPFVQYLSQRWQAGCRNASLLWREIRQQGYPGTCKQIIQWAHERRERPAPTTPIKYLGPRPRSGESQPPVGAVVDPPALPAARRLVWLFLKHSDQLESDELKLRDQLLSHPVLTKAKQLAQDFHRALQRRKPRLFDTWLKQCETAQIPEFVHLAAGMRNTYSAVKAAFTSKYSNGQTEGQVNRLKLLKRQMYGRANLDLLRSRFLAPP